MTEQHPTPSTERAEWFAVALAGVRRLAATGRPFQAHDLVVLLGVPEPPDHHLWGPLMHVARTEGHIVPVAAVPSSRPKTARSLCRLWIGAAHAQEDAVAS